MTRPAAIRGVVPTLLLVCIASRATVGVTIELLNPPPGGLLEPGMGGSYTFDILITSENTFVPAVATMEA